MHILGKTIQGLFLKFKKKKTNNKQNDENLQWKKQKESKNKHKEIKNCTLLSHSIGNLTEICPDWCMEYSFWREGVWNRLQHSQSHTQIQNLRHGINKHGYKLKREVLLLPLPASPFTMQEPQGS